MIPKEALEEAVVHNLRDKVLTEENMLELVTLVNEELSTGYQRLHERLETIDRQLRDVTLRLDTLYDALETSKLTLDDVATPDTRAQAPQGRPAEAEGPGGSRDSS